MAAISNHKSEFQITNRNRSDLKSQSPPAHQTIQKTAPIPKSPPNDPEGAKAPQNEGVKVRGFWGVKTEGPLPPHSGTAENGAKTLFATQNGAKSGAKTGANCTMFLHHFCAKTQVFAPQFAPCLVQKRVVFAPSVCTIVVPQKRYTCIYNTIKPINSIAPLISDLALSAEKHHFCCPLWGKTRVLHQQCDAKT